mmetsp:Transcript_3552/g.9591  ORF Transcript_3552/g.9591 Transcript_3552/m.9591 type:complete len:215 (-) Transcript_3552:798-1442(-)
MHAHLPLCPAPWKRPCHAWWQQHHPSQFQQHGLFPVTMLLAPLALQGAHLLTLVVHLRLRVAQQWTCAACAALEWVLSPKPIVPQLHFVAPSLETATAAAPAPFAAAVVHAAAAVAPGLHAAAAAAAVVAQTAAAAAVAHAVAVFALVAPVAAAAAAAASCAASLCWHARPGSAPEGRLGVGVRVGTFELFQSSRLSAFRSSELPPCGLLINLE